MIVTTTNTIALEMVGEVRFKRYLGVKPKNLLLNCVLGKGRVLFKKKKKMNQGCLLGFQPKHLGKWQCHL